MCCALLISLIPQHSTAACTHKMSDNKKINDGTEAPKKNELFPLQEKLNIINKYDDGIPNVKISLNLGVHKATHNYILYAV